MRKQIKTPAAGQYETAIRAAFARALAAHPTHTKLTGKVFNALCTGAGIVRL